MCEVDPLAPCNGLGVGAHREINILGESSRACKVHHGKVWRAIYDEFANIRVRLRIKLKALDRDIRNIAGRRSDLSAQIVLKSAGCE